MSCYNSERTLHRSVKSILTQTFKNFEFIIVDDGSSDKTSKILKFFSGKDNRIRILKNDKNRGLPYSLNLAFQKSNGSLIARMDDDDIAFPNRLARQVGCFKNNHELSVLGSAAVFLTGANNRLENKLVSMPLTHQDIGNFMFKSSPFIHPTVMMTREFFEKTGGYDDKLFRAQDYDLWLRGRQFGRFENVPEALLYYSYDIKKAHKAIVSTFLIKMKAKPNFKQLCIAITYSSLEFYRLFIYKIQLITKKLES